ncbi:MAG: tyrosine-type recombinase/integrase, partial [Clostridia bacterium]|nr:tyrosine-type recombinase/integrase [Clostridia bacterium]
TFCTRLCENEANIKVIQEVMGHANISITMDIYADATNNAKVESFTKLQGKIRIV